LSRLNIDPFLDRIVTGDEKWILYDNVQRKRQWVDVGDTAEPTSKQGLHPRKVMLCIWWDRKGVVYRELLPPGQTITGDVYATQLDNLSAALASKRPGLVNRKGVILQHDNARPHVARVTANKLKELKWEVLGHPPYSPDIAPSDFHFFRSLSNFLREKKFNHTDALENVLESLFEAKPTSFYEEGIDNLVKR
jgi:[histone H3]-lysine36 N-dimethyltransferase SETMAR